MRDLLLTFDTETTSVNPRTCGVVQVAARARRINLADPAPFYARPSAVMMEMNTFCNPGELGISPGAQAVHGITLERVRDEPADVGVMHTLAEYVLENQDRIIVAGHNVVTFDWIILWRLAGLEAPKVPIIDTLTCATRTLPDAPDHKLSHLCQYLKLGTGEGAHDALVDIAMVEDLIEYFGRGLNMSWTELADWCSVGRVLKTCHFGKHKGKPWGKGKGFVPYFYAKFIADNWETMSPDMVMTLRKHYGIYRNGN